MTSIAAMPAALYERAGTAAGRYRQILVGVDGTPAGESALAIAIAVAAKDATLTLVGTFKGPHWSLLLMGYMTSEALEASARACPRRLCDAEAAVPAQLGVRMIMSNGRLKPALAAEAAAAAYDLLVLASAGGGRPGTALSRLTPVRVACG